MSLLGTSGLATLFARLVPRWARFTGKSLSRRNSETRSSDNSHGGGGGTFGNVSGGTLGCKSGASFNALSKSLFLPLFTFLNALISASIKCFGVRRPDDSVILFVKSRSAMLFHMSCSSFVRIWHQMCIISLTFSSSLRLSWIILATRSLDGKRNFAFAAD